ncbi:MAG: patatin-like phospholipase family protein [Roseococcus sp.]|nr:patatin-like phospholipase family protein [Roseococcus sp.]
MSPSLPCSPSATQTVSIQVVFQGGGARLCHLMAVCEVLRQFEKDKKITIGRVGGSSAGAIAAAMLASNTEMSVFCNRIKEISKSAIPSFAVNPYLGYWRLFWGKNYFPEINLIKIFEEIFKSKEGGQPKISDARIPLQIYFTDLLGMSARICPEDDLLSVALAKSSRIPLAFGGFTSDDFHVDGGLSENLPVDAMRLNESVFGPVIGISFSNSKIQMSHKNLPEYLIHLFSTAIQSGVNRSEKLLGEKNIYRITSPFSTFNFQDAVNTGLAEQNYDEDKERFSEWLDAWLLPLREDLQVSGLPHFVRPSVWKSEIPVAFINELQRAILQDPPTHARRIQAYECAILDKSGKFSGVYRTRIIMNFRTLRPTRVLQFNFNIGKGEFSAANFGCRAVSQAGISLPFTPYVHELGQSPQDAQKLHSYRTFLTFEDSVLPENENVHIELEYTAPDPYPDLDKGREYSVFFRNQGPADEITLAVAFPKEKISPSMNIYDLSGLTATQLDELDYVMDEGERILPSEPMNVGDFIDGLRLEREASKYFLVGRRIGRVENLSSIGFVLDSSR